MDINIAAILNEMNLTVWTIFLVLSMACGWILDAVFGDRSPGMAIAILMCLIGCFLGFGAFIHFNLLPHLPWVRFLAGTTSGLVGIMLIAAVIRRGASG